MKKRLFLVIILTALAGCKKDLTYSYAFNIDGVSYHGENYSAAYRLDTVAALQEFATDFYIGNATDTNYVQVSFSGNNYIAVGTYYTGITNANNTVCSFAYNKGHTYYANTSGVLQILQIDTIGHSIKGNFQFSAVNNNNSADTVHVSNGAFSGIRYTSQ